MPETPTRPDTPAFVRLTTPLTSNRRTLGFVIVAMLIAGSMALIYNLQIKKNEQKTLMMNPIWRMPLLLAVSTTTTN